MMAHEGGGEIPDTQPVSTVIMDGVVAYVEVRSGHDNRSRGIKAQLQSLGAEVVDKLSHEVTHVIFNEGLPSTYKKAKQFRCHLVSVLWIEACKEALDLVPAAGYPPLGQNVYEDPLALKNFKKMKSMQPDFEQEVSDQKIGKILKNIQRRTTHPRTYTVRRTKPKVKLSKCRNRTRPTNKMDLQPPVMENETKGLSKIKNSCKLAQTPENLHVSTSHQNISDGTANPKEVITKSPSLNATPPPIEVHDSESSNSSSVVFCGVESTHLNKTLSDLNSGSKSGGLRDGPPMSRNEFVSHMNDLVQILRSENLKNRQNLGKISKQPLTTNIYKKDTHSSSPERSQECSSSKFKKKTREPLEMGANTVKKDACDSASAYLVRRHMRMQPVEDDSSDVASSESFASGEERPKCIYYDGKKQITLSQIAASYDKLAEDLQKKKLHVPSVESERKICKDICDEETRQLNIRTSEPSVTEGAIRSEIALQMKQRTPTPERDKKTNLERAHSDQDGSSGKENDKTPFIFETSKPPEGSTSPVFHSKRKIRRPMKSTSSKSSDYHPIFCSSVQGNIKQEIKKNATSHSQSTSDSGMAASPNTKFKDDNKSDSVGYRNQNLLRQTFFSCVSTTPNSQSRGEAVVVCEDTPDTAQNIAATSSHDSVYIPQTPKISCSDEPVDGCPSSHMCSSPFSSPQRKTRKGTLSTFDRISSYHESSSNVEDLGQNKYQRRAKTSTHEDFQSSEHDSTTTSSHHLQDSVSRTASKSVHKKRKSTSPIPIPLKKKSESFNNSDVKDETTSCKPGADNSNLDCPSYSTDYGTITSGEHSVSLSPQGRRQSRKTSFKEASWKHKKLQRSLSSDETRKSSQDTKKRLTQSLSRVNSKSEDRKVIVCTFLTASEQITIDSSLRLLDGWSIEAKVTPRTTHVVNSGPRRTVNMLKGMAYGCWLVHQNWIHESAKKGEWLTEEKFELVDFSSAVKRCREKRQTMGNAFKNSLFGSIGPIFVSPKMTSPPAKDLRELIQIWGGVATPKRQTAHLVVGAEDKSVHSVKALWIMDCITKGSIIPICSEYEYQSSH